jgi:fructose 1,6-bisphosphatase
MDGSLWLEDLQFWENTTEIRRIAGDETAAVCGVFLGRDDPAAVVRVSSLRRKK